MAPLTDHGPAVSPGDPDDGSGPTVDGAGMTTATTVEAPRPGSTGPGSTGPGPASADPPPAGPDTADAAVDAGAGPSTVRAWITQWPTLLLVVSGIWLRVVALTGVNGSIDQDQAVAGLMARHVAHGDFGAFFWGQFYGGSADAFLLSPVTALFPGNVLALHATAVAESAIVPVLLWRILRRYVPADRAAFAGAAAWTFPAFAVLFSTLAELFYNPMLIAGLVMLLAGIRFRERPSSWHNPVIWGVAAGFGWWMSPTIVIYALPSVGWLLWCARSRYLVRALPAAVAGSVLGALPWLVVNLREGWPSLHTLPAYGSYAEHARTQSVIGVPLVFGMRHTFTGAWVVPVPLGVALTALLLGVLMWQSIVLLRGRCPLPLILVPGAAVIVWIPFSGEIANGRYIYEVTAVVIAIIASSVRPRPVRMVLAVVIVVASFGWFVQAGEFSSGVRQTLTFRTPGANQDLQDLTRALESAGITRVYSDYWVGGYTLSYFSDERILDVPFDAPRSTQYAQAVAGSAAPSYLFPAGSPHIAWVETWLQHHGIGYRILDVPGFVVVTPDRHVVPTDMVPQPADLAEGVPVSQSPAP